MKERCVRRKRRRIKVENAMMRFMRLKDKLEIEVEREMCKK